MSESNVFMVLYFTGDEVRVAGVYSTAVDADERYEEIGTKYELDGDSVWIEEYLMDKDIDI